MNDLEYGGPDNFQHFGRHGFRGLDRVPLDALLEGDNVAGDIIVAQGTPPEMKRLATGAAGTVFIGGSTFSANLLLSGYARVGSASAPTNVTAGDLTVVRLLVGNAALTANIECQVTGDAIVTGYMRVGSATNPTNVTAGDFTVTRLIVGDAALGTGVEAQVMGDAAVTGWTRIGSTAPPANTTAGDLTATRANVGADTALPAGKEFQVAGDAIVTQELEIDGDLNHDGSNVGLFGVAPAARQTILGSRGGNAALASLLTLGALNGYWIDGTTA